MSHHTTIADTYNIQGYMANAPFASFLPGIAGLEGIPIWCFYCNRGQAICSFGIENKNKSMMEFHPANKSYERVTTHGFRTFIKIDKVVYEPFSYNSINADVEMRMDIEKNVLTLHEYNKALKLEINVSYCIVPQENFGALHRRVSIVNKGIPRDIELVDGMPELLPFGLTLETTKNMSFTARAWAGVEMRDGITLYRTQSTVGDEETVDEITGGYFFASVSNGRVNNKIIYDRDLVFGHCTDLSRPVGFVDSSITDLLSLVQYSENKYSSAFVTHSLELNDELSFDSYYGYVDDINSIEKVKDRIELKNFGDQKINAARSILSDIVDDIDTHTGLIDFDKYLSQTYLDNLLRGGYPLVYERENKTGEGIKDVYYSYGRKHGDLERDYNFFHLEALPYSQGNGNFRDMCQNRHNDVFFHPPAGIANVLTFFNLIQIDGYNPLNVQGVRFSVTEERVSILEKTLGFKMDETLRAKFTSFTYGQMYQLLRDLVHDSGELANALSTVLYYAEKTEEAQYIEGYWIDHFSYLLDLLSAYCEVYPDELDSLLFDSRYTYYDSPARVRTRREKYHMIHGEISQREAVVCDEDKEALIKHHGHHWLTNEKDVIQRATLPEKILSLIANKVATLDPFGVGIEMEANKPGWNDALNGLPGMFGSGRGEVYEVLRLIDFCNTMLSKLADDVYWDMHTQIVEFAQALSQDRIAQMDNFDRWNAMSTMREEYRRDTFFVLRDDRTRVTRAKLIELLNRFRALLSASTLANLNEQHKKIDTATTQAIQPSFYYYTISTQGTYPIAMSDAHGDLYTDLRITQHSLPAFLEAPVKSMPFSTQSEKQDLYQGIKASDIYDKKLKMYKTSESLESQSIRIGRARSFSPGWLERESVFMHMECKYLLQLLVQGMYQEFYTDLFSTLPCFLDPAIYRRPIWENSSFIVSSANSNPTLHGQGFSGRLTGTSSEVLSMWKHMFFGAQLFSLEKETDYASNKTLDRKSDELCFRPSPTLHARFFDDRSRVRTHLFSKTKFEIYNPSGVHAYEAVVTQFELDGVKIASPVIKGKQAKAIRDGHIQTITITIE